MKKDWAEDLINSKEYHVAAVELIRLDAFRIEKKKRFERMRQLTVFFLF